jgi:hypothetical protein
MWCPRCCPSDLARGGNANRFELLWHHGPTTPTQTSATWGLPIAQMVGGAMTDKRVFDGPDTWSAA